MANGPVEMFGVITWDSTKLTQPPIVNKVGSNFYYVLGGIIVHWATMEQEMECLISALLKVNGVVDPGGGREFRKRWRVLKDQFGVFAASEPGLTKEMNEIERLVNTAKQARHGIAHTNMVMGINDKGIFLKFKVSQPHNPWSKEYYIETLQTISGNISLAGGRIYRLMHPDHETSAALPGRSLLRTLPNMDHQRFPTRSKPSRPRQA